MTCDVTSNAVSDAATNTVAGNTATNVATGTAATAATAAKRKTIRDILKKKAQHEPIAIVTSYDYTLASLCDRGGVDILMVGDSAAMVMLGYDSTVHVTVNDMCIFVSAVYRARKSAVIVADMPFMSYQTSTTDAIKNAGILIKAGADSVKVEGGGAETVLSRVRGIVDAGIPVMGHIGLQPQTATLVDGYRVQGRTAQEAKRLVSDAIALEEAGAYAIVLEMVTHEVAKAITESVSIPTIGIGSGAKCDGQVLVIHDMLGMYDALKPKFVKRYCNLADDITKVVASYVSDVKSGQFPTKNNEFSMKNEEYQLFQKKYNIDR